MWIKIEALLCCIIATTLAANESRASTKTKKDDPRGKRNLEYSISHHLTVPSYRAERRISTAPQIQIPHSPYYPLFFPVQKPYIPLRRERPTLPAPPYAVQMEPLVHYSQRDPLYDANAVTFIGDGTNDLKPKDDLLREHSHHSRALYGVPEPHKQIIERPVYIKEPEPIIEIIIKESNLTLPPLPTPPPTLAPKKKEQVQVFYVKYKKNPNAYGKDSIIYDKPIPALSPHIPDEPAQVEPPVVPKYEIPEPTLPPPPSTTLRAIVKPDSETYHADKGIHITFGVKQENEQYKRSNGDDNKEESAHPEPTLTHPQPQGRQLSISQDRQFFPQPPFGAPKRPSPGPPPSFHGPPNFKSERFPPTPNRPFGPPPTFKQSQPPFGRQFPPNFQHQSLPLSGPPPVNFQSQHFPPTRGSASPSFSQQQQLPAPGHSHIPYNQPGAHRSPVPYQPFDQPRPQQSQQSQIQFPRPHTHFPIPQHQQHQLPEIQNQPNFGFNNEQQHLQATHQLFQNNLKQEELVRQQQFHRQPQQQPQISHGPQSQISHRPQSQISHGPQPQISHGPQPQISHGPQSQVSQGSQPQQHQFHQQSQFSQQPQLQVHHQQVQTNQHHVSQPTQFQQQQQPQFSQVQANNFQTHQQPQIQQNFQHQQQAQFTQNFGGNSQIQHERIIPPGGELIQSVPRYEQHISIPSQPSPSIKQAQSSQSQASASLIPSPSLTSNEFQRQISEQFKQQIPDRSILSQFQNLQQQNFGVNIQQTAQQQRQQNYVTKPTTPTPIIRVSPTAYNTPSTTTTEAPKLSTPAEKLTEKDLKALNIELPDEVPDDLREQLLSSGILKNAQISVLDYDKVGDIPISALPPDQLANFYGAGGGQQIAAGSEHLAVAVDKNGEPVEAPKRVSDEDDLEMEGAESAVSEVKAEAPVEMKVVHYDPKTEQGQKVQKSYVKDGATQVDPVSLDGQQYNQYLPVKVNGAAFPIPDVPELKGRTISSVVVLAPVDLEKNLRPTRDVQTATKGSRKIAGEALKVLLKDPTGDNFKDWLDKENKTAIDKQAVVLLVTGNSTTPTDKEIFMYDISTKTVSKLSGELSSAFVNAAETNGKQNVDIITGSSSNVIETRVPYPDGESIDRQDFESDLDDAASDFVETKIPVIDPTEGDNLSEASEQLESFVDISGMPVQPQLDDLAAAASNTDALATKKSSTESPALNDQQYNRYLPIKIDGAGFPISNVAEFKDKKLNNIVVLVPADVPGEKENDGGRKLAGDALKAVLKTPNPENYKKWLEKENKTPAEKQAVVLLVTSEKEIFMYDTASKTASKLNGELSSAFVDAAETNSKQNVETIAASSEIVETRVPYKRIDKEQSDLDISASETVASALESHISISSGYKKT